MTGNPLVVRNGSVITPTGPTEADVTIEGGLITSVGKTGPAGRLDFDATGLVVAPGLIDLQVNGVAGHDVSSQPDSMWAAGEWLASTGVTAYLPTVITGSDPDAAINVMLAGPPLGLSAVPSRSDSISKGRSSPPGHAGPTPMPPSALRRWTTPKDGRSPVWWRW